MATRKRTVKKVIQIGEGDPCDWESIKTELAAQGVDVDDCCNLPGGKVKVVCITPDLKDSVEELGKHQRDQVVMVRVDEETSRSLDAWVESGAVKSRSEAAALFIREGLKVRNSELDRLRDALEDVENAKARLRSKAREVFGDDSSPETD